MIKSFKSRNRLQFIAISAFAVIVLILTVLPFIGSGMLLSQELRTNWQKEGSNSDIMSVRHMVKDSSKLTIYETNSNSSHPPASWLHDQDNACAMRIADNAPSFGAIEDNCPGSVPSWRTRDSSQSVMVQSRKSGQVSEKQSNTYEEGFLGSTFIYLLSVYIFVIIIPSWLVLVSIFNSFGKNRKRIARYLRKIGLAPKVASKWITLVDRSALRTAGMAAMLAIVPLTYSLHQLYWEGSAFHWIDTVSGILFGWLGIILTGVLLNTFIKIRGVNLAKKTEI